MNKVYLDDQIYYIDNFLSQLELDFLKKFYLNLKGWDEEGDGIWEGNLKNICKEDPIFFMNLVDRISLLIDQNNSLLRLNPNIARYRKNQLDPGGYSKWALSPHHDSSKGGVIGGIVLYLNDDYTGGEIVYTEKNITYKPRAGTMIFHPGSLEYKHGVKKVIEGTRYVMTGFVWDREILEQRMLDEKSEGDKTV